MKISYTHDKKTVRLVKLAYIPVLITIIYLFFCYSLVWLLDFRGADIWFSQTIHNWMAPYPYFWSKIFSERSITELIQWFFLGAAAVLCVVRIYQVNQLGESNIWMWRILYLGLLIMLIEDAYNIRHIYADAVSASLFKVDVNSLEYLKSSLRTGLELSFYIFLGGIMCLSFILIIRSKFLIWSGKQMLFCGYFFYAIAAIASVTRNVQDWYIIVGTKIINSLTSISGAEWDESLMQGSKPMGFWIMDWLFEESLELLGAAFILGSMVAFVLQARLRKDFQKTPNVGIGGH